MERVTPVSGLRTGRIEPLRPAAGAQAGPAVPSRALVVVEGGRAAGESGTAFLRDGRAEAGFVTQLLVGADPTLQTSRSIRSWQAAACYAETARLLA